MKKAQRNELFIKNKQMIQDNNIDMLVVALGICIGTFFALWTMSFFVQDYIEFRTNYFSICCVFFVLLCIQKHLLKGKLIIPFIYLCFSLFYLYSCYSSFYLAPEYISVIALLCQIVLPAIIVDKTWRVSLFIIVFYFLYITGVLIYKQPDLISDEIINITAFTIAGMSLGYYIRKMKMENFEYRRIAVLNEQIDFLTDLYNRKKMFMDMEDIKNEKQSCMAFLMLDVDHFKLYNDTYGHVSGDACLRKLGACMKKYAKAHDMNVYRFGGEEFAAIWFGNEQQSYFEIADGLRQAVFDLQIPHAHASEFVSVSIGLCSCNSESQFDTIIKQADEMLYEAKRRGRNTVVIKED